MGYHVEIEMNGVVIPADKVSECLTAINEMFTDENLSKHGGGGCGGPDITEDTPVKQKRWYSWVENPDDNGFTSLLDAINAWRHDGVIRNGDVEIYEFVGGKWGDEEQFYQTIAPFVEDGGTIEVRGEDGEHWRYLYKDGKMIEQHAVVSWE